MQIILPSIKLTECILFQTIKNSKEMYEDCLPYTKLELVEQVNN